jgi:secondary thiamine-phosphate synthase enzyme
MTTIHQKQIFVSTAGRGTYDLSSELAKTVSSVGYAVGVATIFVHHTSASLIICENADPDVRVDLESWLSRAVPDGDALYRHTDEGPDDMPAHVRSTLTATSLSIPVIDGQLGLGVWQGVFLYEHRHAPHRRKISVTLQGV